MGTMNPGAILARGGRGFGQDTLSEIIDAIPDITKSVITLDPGINPVAAAAQNASTSLSALWPLAAIAFVAYLIVKKK